MTSEEAVPPASRERAYHEMEKRRNHLDSLFEIALVLLGILSAAEFQYFLTTEKAELHFYALRVFTVPFVVLIGFWLVKELSNDVAKLHIRMLLTEFCWDFWSFALFYYLLGIYGGFQIGIALSFVLSLLLIYAVMLAYKRASPVETGDRSMHSYYKNAKWVLLRWFVVFLGAYMLLLAIVFPPM
jgi:hypothetical protein